MPNSQTVQRYTAELVNRKWLSDKTFEIVLTRPQTFRFKPGQRICIRHQQISRDYTLVSSPDHTRIILCIRHVPDGLLTPVLERLSLGSQLAFSGPHGYFIYRPTGQPVIFVATGTGTAPFCAMARAGVSGYTLLHGVHHASDLYYAEVFQQTAERYVPCLPAHAGGPTNRFTGRVTRYLKEQLKPGRYDFYLCGQQRMISDAILIIDDRFPGSLVYTEAFEE